MTSQSDSPTPGDLIQMVAKHPLLKTLHRSDLEGLKPLLQWVTLQADEVLFAEGDAINGFYFVIEGFLEVSTEQEDLDGNPDNNRIVLSRISPGATIGEMRILTGGARTATVTAVQSSGLVRFPKVAFDQFLASNKRIVNDLAKAILPRLYRYQMVEILPQLFGELDEQMLRDLESKMSWMHVPRGQVVCTQGEPSESVYVIISGRMQVLIRDPSGDDRQVGEMSQGESIGEMGVFSGEPRSATIIASRDSELIQFAKEDVDELAANYPQFVRSLMKLLIKRLEGAQAKTKTSALSTNILLAPASNGAPLDEIATSLREALSACVADSCLLLTSRIVDDQLGHAGISQSESGEPEDLRLRSWLSQQESQYRVILFQADLEMNAWTKRCIGSSDEVMYVAAAKATCNAASIVSEVQQQDASNSTRRRRSLVLLHEKGVERPTGTMDWLKALNFVGTSSEQQIEARHFHVRRGRDSDAQRVARFLLKREVGLVLSGGGARGFAHVGCIRAMNELNIPIDMIGGVSMGSLVSAAYAYDADQFESKIEIIKSQLKGALFDFTAPVVSFARGRRFDRRLRKWFQDVKIEDLWLPYFCVSSNLTEAGLVVFESESLWWAVRASGTLPGLSSPMIRDNCLLFDGCLLDNLPMDVMRDRLGSAEVIAVDVVPPHDLKVDVPELQSPSGWWLLWHKLNPFASNIDMPNIVSIMHRAAEVGSVYGRQRLIDQKLADLYLQPPLDEIQIADFRMVEEAAKVGYERCKPKLAQWWESHQQDAASGSAIRNV